jgi:uncharacterized protein (TIGR02246 family)
MATRPTPSPTSAQNTRAAIRKLEQTFESAFNANDPKTLVSLYAPDAVLLPPNHAPCQGAGQIEAFFKELRDAGASDVHVQAQRVEESEDLVAVHGTYRFNAPVPTGGTRPDHGNYIVVSRRESNGDLRIVLDTFNSELPPM